MGEDAALTYPYLASAQRVVVCGPGDYYYRQRSNSIVKSVPDISKEYLRLSALFRHLRRKFEGSPHADSVRNQLRYYFYAQVLVRSGAVVPSPDGSDGLIPFRGCEPARRSSCIAPAPRPTHRRGAAEARSL